MASFSRRPSCNDLNAPRNLVFHGAVAIFRHVLRLHGMAKRHPISAPGLSRLFFWAAAWNGRPHSNASHGVFFMNFRPRPRVGTESLRFPHGAVREGTRRPQQPSTFPGIHSVESSVLSAALWPGRWRLRPPPVSPAMRPIRGSSAVAARSLALTPRCPVLPAHTPHHVIARADALRASAANRRDIRCPTRGDNDVPAFQSLTPGAYSPGRDRRQQPTRSAPAHHPRLSGAVRPSAFSPAASTHPR